MIFIPDKLYFFSKIWFTRLLLVKQSLILIDYIWGGELLTVTHLCMITKKL